MQSMPRILLVVVVLIGIGLGQTPPPSAVGDVEPPGGVDTKPPLSQPSPPGPDGSAPLRPWTGYYPRWCVRERYQASSLPRPAWLWYIGCMCRASSSPIFRCIGQCGYSVWSPRGGYYDTGDVYKYCRCCEATRTRRVSVRFRCNNRPNKTCPLPDYITLRYYSADSCNCQRCT